MSEISLSTAKIQKAVQAGVPLSITTYTLPHQMELYMAEVLTAFLKELNQEGMIEYMVYCLGELTTNAKKANTKRVYFKEKGLNINDPHDYETGMENFKNDTLDNIRYYLQLQKNAGLYVKLILQYAADKIKIEVRNNADLTATEYKRIHDKITRAQQYSSVEEAFSAAVDATEGAGLGLIIMVLMLAKIGATGDSIRVFSENGETISRIIVPINKEHKEKISMLSKELVDIIDTLPQFPENIARINTLLNDPNLKLSDIAAQISNDVALTADLLKLVNSAAFSLTNPCHNITDAVKLVGINGIKNLLYSLGSIKSLGNSTKAQRLLWNHSYRVAFYSYNLSRNFYASERAVVDDSYVCGLLHDMGKVVFDSAHPKLIEKFKKLCEAKALSSSVFERLAAGTNHSEIGSLIAEKWNFPKVITESIRYHHAPTSASNDTKKLVHIVYFANMISHYQENEIEFYQFDPEILKEFRIENEEQLQNISTRLQKAFKEET
ncbi:HDOD domain-containing protein [Treponema sp. OMZ 840]|uniref:HDOD domain-containing protein n=1 Tax=Treponema sp. OMZ 840 TaxID=244313 RepID=UPI003D8CD161